MTASLIHIAEVVGADCHSDRTITDLMIDSRSIAPYPTSIFFALRSEGGDGHRFIADLYRRGVHAFVADHIPEGCGEWTDASFLVVADTLNALRAVGADARTRFGGTLAAITGSKGKTTLKEWIFQLMEPLADISRSPRSYNSQIGVPLSLWQLNARSEIALIEAGVSARGEMASLAAMIRPETVVITNIGHEHDEGFSSLEEKAREKALLAAAPSCRTVVFCADAPLVADAVREMAPGRNLLGWSCRDRNAPLFVEYSLPSAADPSESLTELSFIWNNAPHTLRAPLRTEADVENACNALLFMLSEGVEPEVAAARFASLAHLGTRLNVTEGVNDCLLVADSYTSDFSSLRPAIDFMRRRAMPSQKLAAVISDPRHETSDRDVYADMAELFRQAGLRKIIGIGPGFVAHASLFGEEALCFRTTDEMMERMSLSDFSNEMILLKGAPSFGFGRVAEWLEARTHETVLEVNLDAMVRNYNYFRSNIPSGTGIVCMVKASGYGAGSREIAKTLQDCGAAYLAVAVLDEGIDLRRDGISMPIMVMNPKVANYRQMFAHRLEPEIYSPDMLADVVREARKSGIKGYPVHIKLDTGMHRMGFVESEIPQLLHVLSECDEVRVCSVFSHLATADEPSMDSYTLGQLNLFTRLTDRMEASLPYRFKRHILNSAGILRFPQYHFDMVRLGIGLYGANTLPPSMERPLAVVSSLRTVIIALREWEAGTSIGYGRKGMLKRKSTIATIPIGYADGMNRHLGRGAVSVRVNGHEAPTVGNICMDACMIDVTGIDCRVGDSVEIFGTEMPLQRIADILGTIPYEVLTSISPRVKRVYYRE